MRSDTHACDSCVRECVRECAGVHVCMRVMAMYGSRLLLRLRTLGMQLLAHCCHCRLGCHCALGRRRQTGLNVTSVALWRNGTGRARLPHLHRDWASVAQPHGAVRLCTRSLRSSSHRPCSDDGAAWSEFRYVAMRHAVRLLRCMLRAPQSMLHGNAACSSAFAAVASCSCARSRPASSPSSSACARSRRCSSRCAAVRIQTLGSLRRPRRTRSASADASPRLLVTSRARRRTSWSRLLAASEASAACAACASRRSDCSSEIARPVWSSSACVAHDRTALQHACTCGRSTQQARPERATARHPPATPFVFALPLRGTAPGRAPSPVAPAVCAHVAQRTKRRDATHKMPCATLARHRRAMQSAQRAKPMRCAVLRVNQQAMRRPKRTPA